MRVISIYVVATQQLQATAEDSNRNPAAYTEWGEICMSESNATVLTACRAHYLHTDDRNDAGDVWEWMN